MKLLAIWFYEYRSMAIGESEDRFAQSSICWRRTPGSQETACLQRWMTGWLEKESHGSRPSSSSSSSNFECHLSLFSNSSQLNFYVTTFLR